MKNYIVVDEMNVWLAYGAFKNAREALKQGRDNDKDRYKKEVFVYELASLNPVLTGTSGMVEL